MILPGLSSSGFRAWFGLGLCLLACGAGAQTLILPPAPLLPAHLGAYEAVETPVTGADAVQAAHGLAGGGNEASTATVLREDGLAHFAAANYSRAGGAETPIELEALEFGDATGAFAAYTALRGAEAKVLPKGTVVGAEASEQSAEMHEIVLLAGTTVVLARGAGTTANLPIHDLAGLIAGLPKVSGTRGARPLLPTYLPDSGLKLGTLHYAIGPQSYAAMGGLIPDSTLAWDKSTEVASAQYAGKGGRGLLTLIFFPTPAIAGDRSRAIDGALKSLGGDQAARLGEYRLRREGPMLLLASGGFTAEQAQALVDGIHLRTELTYNKQMPLEFHAEIQKTTSLLSSIAIFCGVGALAAILLGLFLGGGRAAIRVLQGKSASSDPEFLSINLRGKVNPFVTPGESGEASKAER